MPDPAEIVEIVDRMLAGRPASLEDWFLVMNFARERAVELQVAADLDALSPDPRQAQLFPAGR